MTELTLPEELLLLALDPVTGRRHCGRRYLQYGLAGAVLAELELQGRVAEAHGRVTVVNPLPPQDRLSAQILASLPAPGKSRFGDGIRARPWVRRTGREVEELCLHQLVGRGALRVETRRLLGLIPYHRYPAAAEDWSAPVRGRYAASVSAGFPDRRGRLLAAFTLAIGLAGVLNPRFRSWRARGALRALVREEWAPYAVHRAVQQDKQSSSSGGGLGGDGGSGGDGGGGD
ncbi:MULTISPECIES: GPP34 family phosphoprotein [unclassified Streptomyces]|uniref:GOLPH3/VPS74 family protein n=1 Tax=unclassified Streptomyces TaxID=2593676 RepID=UPI002DD98832|nr:GPP34 family phosphoprotein [Streptomyces sp. NBC_01750]WSB00979.1 GPP34 family phosphoprotein [Streptomyces sp. NBC_01794]WSD34667.1 GPP34 family phosphoprotein [Streptomyces sp. NBC_01750]